MSQLLGLRNGGGGGGGGGLEGDRGRHRVPDGVLGGLRRRGSRRRRQTAITELEYRRQGRSYVGPSLTVRYLGGDQIIGSQVFFIVFRLTTELVAVLLVWLPAVLQDLFSTFGARAS